MYHDLVIDNPKLWWPNGIGKPNIYNFTVKLIKNDPDNKVNEKKITFGIRTVQVDKSDKNF
jgi:beta-galactosidase/beta-glucuronidase